MPTRCWMDPRQSVQPGGRAAAQRIRRSSAGSRRAGGCARQRRTLGAPRAGPRSFAPLAARERRHPLVERRRTQSELRTRLCRPRLRLGLWRSARARPEVLGTGAATSSRDPFLALYAPTVRYMALFALERYEEAVTVCRATAELYPNHVGAWRLMTVSLGLLGRIDEAARRSRTRTHCSPIFLAITSTRTPSMPTRPTARGSCRGCGMRG